MEQPYGHLLKDNDSMLESSAGLEQLSPVSVESSKNNIYAEGARRENRADNLPQTGTEIGHSEPQISCSTFL